MRVFIEPTTCDVCGAEGLGRPGTMADKWIGARVVHINPDVCREILADKNKKLQEKISSLEGH